MRRARGLTLMEIMVSMAVLGLVMTAALTLYLPSLGRFTSADAAYDAQRHALAAVSMVSADLKESAYGLLIKANPVPPSGGPQAPAVYIPTARDLNGTYHVKSDDTPDWQGWALYWCTPEPSPAVGVQLHRAFVAGKPEDDPPPALVGSGRVVAGGLSSLRIEAGQNPTPILPRPGDIGLFLDLTSSAYTPGGRGRARVVATTLRLVHDQGTTFEGDKTVDIPY